MPPPAVAYGERVEPQHGERAAVGEGAEGADRLLGGSYFAPRLGRKPVAGDEIVAGAVTLRLVKPDWGDSRFPARPRAERQRRAAG
jgi:hypothetical protein